jgi:hypothetical protein
MAIVQAMCTSFKSEILQGLHQFTAPTLVSRGSLTAPTSDTFKIALYTSAATLGNTTTVYSTSNEVVGTGYTAAGNTLTGTTLATGGTTVAYLDFTDTTWSTATITANGALIYNSTQSGKAVAVLAFGGDKTSTAGDFTIQFPTPDSTNAIIRIA